jgi:hypothetical protein
MNSIHNPTIQVKLRPPSPAPAGCVATSEGEVAVRELSWPDALHLYNRLMSQSKAFMDDNGQLVLDAARVINAIQENIELGTWLVQTATGKDESWLRQRSLSEVLNVATEAAVLNVGIIVERIKNARSRLRRIAAGESETQNTNPSDSTGKSPT